MADTKFTKGSFKIAGEGEHGVGQYTLYCCRIEEDLPENEYRGSIASIHSADHIDGISYEEAKANAHLLSAAGDLYEACKSIDKTQIFLDCPEDEDIVFISYKTFKKIKAAMAKARGE